MRPGLSLSFEIALNSPKAILFKGNLCCDRKTRPQNTNAEGCHFLHKDNANEVSCYLASYLAHILYIQTWCKVYANCSSKIKMTHFIDASFSLFSLWHFEMKCKNNIRRCVPTCLPEYSAIVSNSRILQPLQPAAAPMPQVALMGFFIEIQGGFSGFSVSHRCKDKEQLFQPFRKKAHWHVGCGNRLCNFMPSQIKNAHQTIRGSRPREDASVGSVDASFPDTVLFSIHLWQHSQWKI